MSIEQSAVVPRLGSDAEIVVAATGELVLRSRGQFAILESLSRADLQAIMREVDGTRTVSAIIQTLSDRYEQGTVLGVLDALRDLTSPAPTEPTFIPATAGALPGMIESSIVVVGNGRLSSAIAKRLRMGGFRDVRRVEAHSFASYRDDRFRQAKQRIIARHTAIVDDFGDAETAHSVGQLATQLAGAGLVVCTLEGTFFRGVLDVNAACISIRTPALFVTVDAESVHIGPSYIPSLSACFECVNTSSPEVIRGCLELFSTYSVSEDESLDRVIELVATEAGALASATVPPQFVTRLVSVPRYSTLAPLTQLSPVMRAAPGTCVCDTEASRDLPRHLQVNADIALINSRVDEPRAGAGFEDVPDPCRTVGVIGGGTAGYFAALAIKARLPHLAPRSRIGGGQPVPGPARRCCLHTSIAIRIAKPADDSARRRHPCRSPRRRHPSRCRAAAACRRAASRSPPL